jgi:4-carboxymuconolactone decarboxylase
LQRVFTNAERERQRLGQTETTSEHFLMAIAYEKEDNAAQLLARFGATYDKLCQLTVAEVATDDASEFLQQMEAQRGYVLDFHRIMAKYDLDFAKSYNGLLDAAYLKERLLDARTKEFIITTAIIVAASSEEHIVTHMKVLKRLGVTAEEALQFIEIILPPAGVPKFMNAVECWKKVWEITA